MGLEVEARFRASDASALDDLAHRHSLGRAELGPARVVDEEDRYLDTADGRLAAARWACRLRSRDGRTTVSLKGPPEASASAPTTGWLHRRPELEGPALGTPHTAAWPPSEARDRLEELSGGMPLTERLTLQQRRTERPVALDGEAMGTLSLDSIEPQLPSGARADPFHIVELELTEGSAAEGLLAPLADALAATPGLTPEPRTKLEIALELLAADDAARATEPPGAASG